MSLANLLTSGPQRFQFAALPYAFVGIIFLGSSLLANTVPELLVVLSGLVFAAILRLDFLKILIIGVPFGFEVYMPFVANISISVNAR